MEQPGIVFGLILVVVLLGLAAFSVWRQRKTLRLLRTEELSDADRRFFRGQVRRRLISAALMVVFAGLLVGSFFLTENLRDLRPAEQPAAQDQPPQANAEQRGAIQLFTFYWIVALLVLLGILALAAVDMWAIAKYGVRHHRQIEADRRAMIEEEAARYRQQGNGRG